MAGGNSGQWQVLAGGGRSQVVAGSAVAGRDWQVVAGRECETGR